MLQHTISQARPARVEQPTGRDGRGLSPWQSWRPKRHRQVSVLSVAELAECTCPDLCDRDHPNE